MKHNTYFDGKVQSLGVNTVEGYATVGVMEPGKYTFSTDAQEHFTIVTGRMKVKLPGQDWMMKQQGDKIIIEAKASFDLDVEQDVAYLCYYK